MKCNFMIFLLHLPHPPPSVSVTPVLFLSFSQQYFVLCQSMPLQTLTFRSVQYVAGVTATDLNRDSKLDLRPATLQDSKNDVLTKCNTHLFITCCAFACVFLYLCTLHVHALMSTCDYMSAKSVLSLNQIHYSWVLS